MPALAAAVIAEAVSDEADVSTVQDGGEPFGHGGQPGDDLGEVIQSAAAAQFFGVVDGALEAQAAPALGAGLQLQPPDGALDPGPAGTGLERSRRPARRA